MFVKSTTIEYRDPGFVSTETGASPAGLSGCTGRSASPIMAAMPDLRDPTDDEIAAALAAVRMYLDSPDAESQSEPLGWRAAARLETQQVRPARVTVRPSWSTVERLRRQAATGFLGGSGLSL